AVRETIAPRRRSSPGRGRRRRGGEQPMKGSRKVERSELLDYVTYEEQRAEIRPRMLETKRPRRITVGPYLTFLFENHDTVWYQVQEMMRSERIVKEADIRHELDTYNELLGDEG